MRQPTAKLMESLGYRFGDELLLELALSHRSVGAANNERLEFLGDAILSYFISIELYQRFPEAGEGRMSRMRAALVKGDNLAQMARALDLGSYLHLGSGELKSGGFRRGSILADTLEALFGAVYIDGGIEGLKGVIHTLFAEQLNNMRPDAAQKDPKTELQELLQGQGLPLPNYQVLRVEGQAHDQHFTVSCRVEGLEGFSEGEAASRRKAEQAAAASALLRLQEGISSGG